MGSLLDEISKLRGSISSYRANKEITNNAPYSATYASRGRGRGRRGLRIRGRGGGRGGSFTIRNRTLVVRPQEDPSSDYITVMTSNGHKLVNKELYEKELKQKNLTKEEKQKALEDKKVSILRKKQAIRSSKNRVKLDYCDWCVIDGDTFAISRYGAKLVLLDIPEGSKPISAPWNEKNYRRTKTGNLRLMDQKVFLKEQCRYFQKTGECSRGISCKYSHNKTKLMLCPKFIKGNCTNEACPLSHEPTEFNTALCHFFIRGNCKNERCPFLHITPEFELICRQFAIGGYCFRGSKCKFRHVHECPDFQLTQNCPRGKNCRLQHKYQDSTMARLEYNSLDPKYLQLPDLTKMDDINSDPRIILDIEENQDEVSDSDDSDDDSHIDQNEYLEVDADFIHF